MSTLDTSIVVIGKLSGQEHRWQCNFYIQIGPQWLEGEPSAAIQNARAQAARRGIPAAELICLGANVLGVATSKSMLQYRVYRAFCGVLNVTGQPQSTYIVWAGFDNNERQAVWTSADQVLAFPAIGVKSLNELAAHLNPDTRPNE